jgi:hypothetical protein
MNRSQINDTQVWKKLKESGAVGTIEDYYNRVEQGIHGELNPDKSRNVHLSDIVESISRSNEYGVLTDGLGRVIVTSFDTPDFRKLNGKRIGWYPHKEIYVGRIYPDDVNQASIKDLMRNLRKCGRYLTDLIGIKPSNICRTGSEAGNTVVLSYDRVLNGNFSQIKIQVNPLLRISPLLRALKNESGNYTFIISDKDVPILSEKYTDRKKAELEAEDGFVLLFGISKEGHNQPNYRC